MNALTVLFGVAMLVTAVFLILLVLVQRGRGGGLSGALGGMGGQSAFGTKAGDLFTKITMYVAAFWILLCIATILVLNPQKTRATGSKADAPEFTTTAPASENDKIKEKEKSETPSEPDAKSQEPDKAAPPADEPKKP